MLRTTQFRRASGFTLVEIMIVVAIIALLAAIAVPNFLRARKRSQATMTLEILRQIDDAKDLYAIEFNKVGDSSAGGGVVPSCADLLPYAKPNSLMANQLAANHITDVFGRDIAINAIDLPPQITHATYDNFAEVVPTDFWSPYGSY